MSLVSEEAFIFSIKSKYMYFAYFQMKLVSKL